MLAYLIHTMEAAVLLLVGMTYFKVRRLVSEDSYVYEPVEAFEQDEAIYVQPVETETTSTVDYEAKMQCLKLAQAFVGNQMLDIKRSLTNDPMEQPEWLRLAVSLYLIGAIDFIGKQSQCDSKSRKELIEIVLKSNLQINADKAKAFFIEAVCREPQSDNDHMVLAGAQAAKAWLENQAVPEENCLKTRVQDWGMVA